MSIVIVGHRGAKGLAPENTLKAFEIGSKYSDYLECDVHLSADGQLVVIHDGTLRKTAHRPGYVVDYSLRDLKKFDFGGGEKIPTVDEVVDVAEKNKKGLIIEIKGLTQEEADKVGLKLAEFMKERTFVIPVFVCSFWHKTVEKFKESLSDIKTFIAVDDSDSAKKSVELINNANADGIGIRSDLISKEIVDDIHKNNFFVDAWVVNEAEEFRRLKDIGVDWITTDYPDKFSKIID